MASESFAAERDVSAVSLDSEGIADRECGIDLSLDSAWKLERPVGKMAFRLEPDRGNRFSPGIADESARARTDGSEPTFIV